MVVTFSFNGMAGISRFFSSVVVHGCLSCRYSLILLLKLLPPTTMWPVLEYILHTLSQQLPDPEFWKEYHQHSHIQGRTSMVMCSHFFTCVNINYIDSSLLTRSFTAKKCSDLKNLDEEPSDGKQQKREIIDPRQKVQCNQDFIRP